MLSFDLNCRSCNSTNRKIVIILTLFLIIFCVCGDSYAQIAVVSQKKMLRKKFDIDKINKGLAKGDMSVLSILPAKEFGNVASVMRAYSLQIDRYSAFAEYDPINKLYRIGIDVSRKSHKVIPYADLCGLRATWVAVSEFENFVPENDWAKNISNADDDWLRFGGAFENDLSHCEHRIGE